jgi:hypothetical protein
MVGDEPTVPLFDVNDVFVREISAKEYEALVTSGEAVSMKTWQGKKSTITGLKLSLPRDYRPSDSCLTDRDARLIAGESGPVPAAYAARRKLAYWRDAH